MPCGPTTINPSVPHVFRSSLFQVKGSPSSPLFLLPAPWGLQILNVPMISSTQSKVVRLLGHNPSHCGFHAFRSSGVSWAVDHDFPIQNLKAQGGWTSNAINSYLQNTPHPASTVAYTFKSLLSHGPLCALVLVA